jgi:hypothetical protein
MSSTNVWHEFKIQELIKLIKAGCQMVDIARYYEITRQRVYVVCDNHDIDVTALRPTPKKVLGKDKYELGRES